MKSQINPRICVYILQPSNELLVAIKLFCQTSGDLPVHTSALTFQLFACKVMQKWRGRGFGNCDAVLCQSMGARQGELLLSAFVVEACNSLFLWLGG